MLGYVVVVIALGAVLPPEWTQFESQTEFKILSTAFWLTIVIFGVFLNDMRWFAIGVRLIVAYVFVYSLISMNGGETPGFVRVFIAAPLATWILIAGFCRRAPTVVKEDKD